MESEGKQVPVPIVPLPRTLEVAEAVEGRGADGLYWG